MKVVDRISSESIRLHRPGLSHSGYPRWWGTSIKGDDAVAATDGAVTLVEPLHSVLVLCMALAIHTHFPHLVAG